MFRLLLFIALLISSVMPGFTQSVNPQRYSIRYADKIKTGNVNFENQKLTAKARRLSSNKGNINLVYFDEVPDSMKVALSAAATLWEAKISNKYPIYIGVIFQEVDPEIAVAADVYYYEYKFNNDTVLCPSSLLSQIGNEYDNDENSVDGYIYLNPNLNWNCTFTTENFADYNLTTMALRGIARCLGFGADIFESDYDYFEYLSSYPTCFDKYLFSNSTCLVDIEIGSSKMAEFVKSDNVYFKSTYNSYKIYAPNEFIQDMSLCYIDDDNSLMSHALGKGNCVLTIDEKTIDILRTIGWNLPETGLRIKSDEISDDGIASSYINHTFYLDKGDITVTNYQWKFLLKNKSGEFELISAGNSDKFSIDKIETPENFYVNINGDLEGRIECSYHINGENFNAIPFSISFELKPKIISIDNIEKHYSSKYGFYLTFTVQYTGADAIYTRVEEDYSYGERVYWCYEPYLAHVKTGIITNLFYSWVTVEVENNYGIVEETLEFEPEYDIYSPGYNILGISDSYFDEYLIDEIQIFSLNGILIYEGSPFDLSMNKITSGLYIKKEFFRDGTCKTSKLTIK